MDEWIRFGIVRGAFGLIISMVLIATFATTILPATVTPVQQYYFGVEDNKGIFYQTLLSARVFTLVVAFMIVFSLLLAGFQYWLGAKLVERFDIDVTGYWKAVTAGILGGLVISLVFAIPMYLYLPFTGATKSTWIVALLSIPVFIISEIFYASVTWWSYKHIFEWQTPS